MARMSMKTRNRAIALIAQAVLILIAANAKIGEFSPFAPCIMAAIGTPFAAVVYVAASYATTLLPYAAVAAAVGAAVRVATWFLALKTKFFSRQLVTHVCNLVSILAAVATSLLYVPISSVLLSAAVGAIFYYFAVGACRFMFEKRFEFRPQAVESASILAVTGVVGYSLSFVAIDFFPVGIGLCFLLTVLIAQLFGAKEGLFTACALGIGYCITGDLLPFAALALAAMCCAPFLSMPRFVSVFAALAGFCACIFAFATESSYALWSACACLAGFLVYALPPKIFRDLAQALNYEQASKTVTRYFINNERKAEGNALMDSAQVFGELSRFMNAPSEELPPTAMAATLSTVCEKCKATECDKFARETAFNQLSAVCMGKVAGLSDLPEFFTESCTMPAEVLTNANVVSRMQQERRKKEKLQGGARALLGDRLDAVRDVLKRMAQTAAAPIGYDRNKEERIRADLVYAGIECAEVFVTEKSVVALVRDDLTEEKRMRKVVSRVMGAPYLSNPPERTQCAGWSAVVFYPSPRYDALFSHAAVAKGAVSGDNFTFTRVNNKFITALSDGMGTGSGANKTSSAAVELIECFYRAGFDSRSVIEAVNGFMKLPDNESYSASDVCVTDLETGVCDIIKLGSPASYIKTADTVLRLEGSALPIGVVGEIHPYAVTRRLTNGLLILVTDGISDCFEGDTLAHFINTLSPVNPKAAADAILARALKISGGARDDMTVIAVRLVAVKKRRLFSCREENNETNAIAQKEREEQERSVAATTDIAI